MFVCVCLGIRLTFQYHFMSYPYFAFFFLTHLMYIVLIKYTCPYEANLINFEQSRVNYRLINKNKQFKK